ETVMLQAAHSPRSQNTPPHPFFMPDPRRTVFFVSDGTGITVEMLGHSLLTQFDGIQFEQTTVPFVVSVERAQACVTRIDEASARDPDKADVILVGVSRTGKTPTSLYLSLQFGIRAANCPLIPEDFDRMSLPAALQAHRRKLFGLSIAPERLREIRNERRPNSQYADLENCRYEVQQAEKLMSREGIRWAN